MSQLHRAWGQEQQLQGNRPRAEPPQPPGLSEAGRRGQPGLSLWAVFLCVPVFLSTQSETQAGLGGRAGFP